jgi:hypothetical protein
MTFQLASNAPTNGLPTASNPLFLPTPYTPLALEQPTPGWKTRLQFRPR